MIEIKQIDRENIQYFIYNLENFEKDKAIGAVSVLLPMFLELRGGLTSGPVFSVTENRQTT